MERSSLARLLELGREARRAESLVELDFLLVNDSHALAPYRQAALWRDGRTRALSGVMQVEANVPYVLWLDGLFLQLTANPDALVVERTALPPTVIADWDEWLPEQALWLPLDADSGLLLARDLPWQEAEIAVLCEWVATWRHARQAQLASQPRWTLWPPRRSLTRRPRRWAWALALIALLLIPVRLTVLAPGELVPASPAVIRAPLEGVIDTFHVQPNEAVRQGQALFGFDEALIQNRLDVARQALASAEAEYRQAAQQALADPRAKAQLAVLTGKIEEKRAEVAYGNEQLSRARVLAPRDGIALFDDPSEWVGRPLAVGEWIMRIAAPADVEVEAWVPLADAIPLADGSHVALHLNASPLAPASATLRYFAHDAVERPDGSYAYRVRARLDAPTEHRVGLKGTARFSGGWVPLGYWALRRPLASLRAMIGW